MRAFGRLALRDPGPPRHARIRAETIAATPPSKGSVEAIMTTS